MCDSVNLAQAIAAPQNVQCSFCLSRRQEAAAGQQTRANQFRCGCRISRLDAWAGALAYTLQIYFDFSGYSDMAIGLGTMFGIKLPLNFFSPYKARSIIDFWRRWHMTLSRFLREYLYFPLGGNRRGEKRHYANVLVTMLLGGLWHGAGWTFVVWGGLHGIYIVVNHAWRRIRTALAIDPFGRSWLGRESANWITMGLVVIAWVFFRAESFSGANRILRGMFGFNGLALPGDPAALADWQQALQGWGIAFPNTPGVALLDWQLLASLVVLIAITRLAPNTQQIMVRYQPAIASLSPRLAWPPRRWMAWRANLVWASASGLAFGMVLLYMLLDQQHVSEFIYWNF